MEAAVSNFANIVDVSNDDSWKITKWDLLVVSMLVFSLIVAYSPMPSGRCANDVLAVKQQLK